MTGRVVSLNAAKGGINRQRVRGGADPSTLYDLENGYVDASGVIRSRPGVDSVVQLPAGTKGLCAYAGRLVVFSHAVTAVPASTPSVECVVISHPTLPTLALHDIHFAGPILGFLYVVAEFSNGDVWHYWLESAGKWTASNAYRPGDVVLPTIPNGLAYRAYRLAPAGSAWQPNTEYATSDVVEPSVFAGYTYTAIETYGVPPRSGDTEPDWPTEGAVTEESDVGTTLTAGVAGTQSTALSTSISDRYENPIWIRAVEP